MNNPYADVPRLPFARRDVQRVSVVGSYPEGDSKPTHLEVRADDGVCYRMPLTAALVDRLVQLMVEYDRDVPDGAVIVVEGKDNVNRYAVEAPDDWKERKL